MSFLLEYKAFRRTAAGHCKHMLRVIFHDALKPAALVLEPVVTSA
jgi:hypothetical protein